MSAVSTFPIVTSCSLLWSVSDMLKQNKNDKIANKHSPHSYTLAKAHESNSRISHCNSIKWKMIQVKNIEIWNNNLSMSIFTGIMLQIFLLRSMRWWIHPIHSNSVWCISVGAFSIVSVKHQEAVEQWFNERTIASFELVAPFPR